MHRGAILWLTLLAITMSGCIAKVVVRPVSPTEGDQLRTSGVFYTLPRTVVTFGLTAKVTEGFESPFISELLSATAAYDQLLKGYPDEKARVGEKWASDRKGVKDALLKRLADSDRYRTIKQQVEWLGVKVTDEKSQEFELVRVASSTRAEPDPEHVYLVELRGSPLQDRSIALDLSEQGLLTNGDVEVADKSVEFVVKVIDLGAKIAARALLAKALPALSPDPRKAKTDEEARLEAVFKHADEVLVELRDLHTKRVNLAGGVSPQTAGNFSVQVFERLLQELKAIEDGLVAYFSKTKVHALSADYDYRPPSSLKRPHKIDLFSFSKAGINQDDARLLSAGVRAAALPAIFRGTGGKEKLVSVSIVSAGSSISGLKGTPGSELSAGDVVALRTRAPRGTYGFVYRLPETVVVTTSVGGDEAGRVTAQVAQFGPVRAMPSSTGSFNNKYSVFFYKETGALKSVRAVSKALDPAIVDKMSSSAETVQKAKNEREDELLQLERRRKILDEARRIRDLERELAGQ